MAIDVCSEISSPGLLSPRISFSHDLKGCGDAVPVEDDRSRRERLDRSLLDSDFDFCVGASSFVLELCPADELFSDGKILPSEIRRDRVVTDDPNNCRQILSSRPPPPPPPLSGTPISSAASTEKKSLKELLLDSFDDSDDYDDDEGDEKPPPKPFWQFKRSCSLNCDVAKSRGLIRSSLQFLSRSNSTGSVPNPEDKFAAKDNQRQNLQKQPSISRRRSSSEPYQSSFGMPFSYTLPQPQKPPTKKKRYGHGVRVNPVLNFQPHITIGTVSLFGLGSLFCNGKVRKKKKK